MINIRLCPVMKMRVHFHFDGSWIIRTPSITGRSRTTKLRHTGKPSHWLTSLGPDTTFPLSNMHFRPENL